MKDLIILGAGAAGKELLWFIASLNQKAPQWRVVGFADDTPEKQGAAIDGYPVLGTIDNLRNWQGDVWLTCPIGSSAGRRRIVEKLTNVGHLHWATLAALQPATADSLRLGRGVILYPGTTVTSHVTIGDHSIVNIGASLSHDTVLESFVTISPGATLCGNVYVASGGEIGAGSVIIEKRRIASGAVVGAGAVVIRDITESGTYVGVPAAKIK